MAELWEKSSTVDPEVRAYVYSLVSAVGGQSTLDDRYAIGDDALAVLNDLLRWLRLYDEKTNRYDVKRCLAEANLVKGDLLEILALWPEDAQENKLKSKLALACLQLLVPLTWPIELEEEKTTVNHLRHTPYLQLAQVGYKRAVLHYEDAKILRTVVRIGLPSMAQPRRERSKRDEGIIKLMLYFFRNMAMITQPQHLPSQGDENEISRSATIQAFQEQDVFNLLLTVGSGAGDEFQEQDVIVLETLFHLLKGVDAKKLFLEKEQLEKEEVSELQSLMQKEKAMLNSYNKHAPTRHNRFGTMLWVKREDQKMSTLTGQNSITNADSTLLQMDASKKINKPRYRGKQTEELNESAEFGARIDLTETARKHLRSFVEDFLDSSFNPLFSSLRKAIERETDRVGPIHHRQFFYLISWFLSAESARRRQQTQSQAHQVSQTNKEDIADNTYAYIAAVLDQETFVLLTRHMQRCFDEKSHHDLRAILLCFTQILLTVQSMSESKDEEDQEIAENIQNRIFYEEATHDLLVSILRGYKGQGFGYLDAVTECVHVFVRMLERYSKQNVDLQIRSKRRARKKRKQQIRDDTGGALPEDGIDEAQHAENDEYDAHQTVRERNFDFARFSAKFLSQPCVNTFISLLQFYGDLSAEQLKRCHRYLYRLAFKHELAIFLFRVDILQLLHRMIKGPGGLDPAHECFKEWEQLVQQIFKKCIKWVERSTEGDEGGRGWREAAVVEMLFSKIPGSLFYLQNGFERVVEKRAPRAPAELEFKGSVGEDMEKRVGIVVSVLLDQGKQDTVEWVKKEIKNAAVEREAWEIERHLRSVEAVEDLEGAVLDAPTIFINPDNDERKEQLFKDKHLRLLLTTLGLQRLGTAEDVDASWIIPSEMISRQLTEIAEGIQKAVFDPPTFDDGKSALDLIRNRSANRRGAAAFSDTEESGSDGDIDESLFPANLRERRKEIDPEQPKKKRRLHRRNRAELTDEQVKEREDAKRRREKERNGKIKSQLFVEESDDEEADREFFRLEEERRRKMAGIIRSQLRKEAEGAAEEGGKKGKKRKSKGGKKVENARKRRVDDEDTDMVSDGSDISIAKKRRRRDVEDVDMLADSSEHSSSSTHEGGTPASAPLELPLGMSTDGESPREDRSEFDSEIDFGPGESRNDRVGDKEDDETPSTSQNDLPLGEVSGNAGLGVRKSVIGDDDEDDEVVKAPTQRRNVRAAFIVEDESE